jgi:hypothetical protein
MENYANEQNGNISRNANVMPFSPYLAPFVEMFLSSFFAYI